MEGKTIEKVELLHEINVLARNYPTEKKPTSVRLHFKDGTHSDIEIDSRGYFGDFTYFLNIKNYK